MVSVLPVGCSRGYHELMNGWLTRAFVTVLVTLAILAPQGAGLAALSGLADGRVMVICTGDGLRTIRIGADGEPADISDKAEYCAMTHAADTANAVVPPSAHTRLPARFRPVRPRMARPLQQSYPPSFPRAPPAV